jgi:N-acetylated-alpha-linked acidic dipeptidase
VPSPSGVRAAHRLFSRAPHVAGTPQDKHTAHAFLALLQRELGIPPIQQDPPAIFPAGSAASRDATLGAAALAAPRAWIDEYYPALNTPGERALQIVDADGGVLWEAELEEHAPEDAGADPDAARWASALPAWHGLSADGDVTGALVDVGYGTKEDYDALAARGAWLGLGI